MLMPFARMLYGCCAFVEVIVDVAGDLPQLVFVIHGNQFCSNTFGGIGENDLIPFPPAFLFLGVGQSHGDLVDYITAHIAGIGYITGSSPNAAPRGISLMAARPDPTQGKLGQRGRVSGACRVRGYPA